MYVCIFIRLDNFAISPIHNVYNSISLDPENIKKILLHFTQHNYSVFNVYIRCPLKQCKYISSLHVLINNIDMDLYNFYYYFIRH